MEQAYQARGKAFNIQLEANSQNNHHNPNDITIHKLFGSFNISEEDAGPTLLPITEYDHRQPQTIQRVSKLWQQLATAVQNGAFLLMLCPTEDELMSAYQYCQPGTASGLIWMAGGDISEEEQDVYRNLDFRVLPDTPDQLLKVLFTLTNYEGQEVPGLAQD